MITDEKYITRISKLLDADGWELDINSMENELYVFKDCIQINNPELGISLQKHRAYPVNKENKLELCADGYPDIMVLMKPSFFGFKKNPTLIKYEKLVEKLWNNLAQDKVDKMYHCLESILNSVDNTSV